MALEEIFIILRMQLEKMAVLSALTTVRKCLMQHGNYARRIAGRT